jgi:signal transduction histidine kinase
MVGGLTDVREFAAATCLSLQRSAKADAVVMLESLPDIADLRVTATAGTPGALGVLGADAARAAIREAVDRGERRIIIAPRGALAGNVAGLAQPVLRDGRTVAVLAIGWTSPRRGIPERVDHAAVLFAAGASVALDRAERLSQDRERQALEINDNIVQGLVMAKYLAQRGDHAASVEALDETLGRARELITDQLAAVADLRGGLRPGDLARAEASSVRVTPLPEGDAAPALD